MEFTEQQIQRYSRHIILNEVGGKGQVKLSKAKVLLIGAGGLAQRYCPDITFRWNAEIIRPQYRHFPSNLRP